MASDRQQQVRRRRVFYIPGYDPIHPRRYRELYRKESTAQADISGYEIELKAKQGHGPYGWQVSGRFETAQVHADIDVLVWSDIVRDSMSNSIPATYLQLIRTAWIYIPSGVLRRLMRMRKGPVIAALYPVGMLILQVLLALVVGFGVAAVVNTAAGWVPFQSAVIDWLVLVLKAGAGLASGIAVLRFFKNHDNRLFVYYLMHDYAYSAQLNGANPPALETRMSEFADLIAQALREDVDEVLIVGHSSGVHIGVSVLADLIRANRVPANGPDLAFLSLGQVVPMVSFLKNAVRLRTDLRFLSAQESLCWVDVSAPGDGCAFALCDPVAVSGVAPKDKKWPLVISAAFTQTLSPARWAKLRWRFFRLHFQYLCAFDQPGDFDYFQITAGPQTLAARYSGRQASKSRIDVPVSKYTSVQVV